MKITTHLVIKIRKLFYSKQGRLFSIWRFLRLFIVYGPLIHGILYNILKLFNIKIPGKYDPLTIVAAIILTTVFLDKEKIESLGIEFKLKSLILFICGILWAYFCCVQIEIIGVFTSNSTFQFHNPFTIETISSLGYYVLIIGLSEELLFRSYLISNIGRDLNLIIALIISSILFSLMHIVSGSWSNIPVGFSGGFIFTLLFGLTFIMTKSIFLAIGFHGAWDTLIRLFNSEKIGIEIILIVLFLNTLIFYLIYKRVTNFDNKSLIMWQTAQV
jgi:membrane protease YdiL (CAAX protease family)